jgi:hypothetical protein
MFLRKSFGVLDNLTRCFLLPQRRCDCQKASGQSGEALGESGVHETSLFLMRVLS